MKKSVQILDCTLRDGGLGLEDAYINEIADLSFTEEDVRSISEYLALSGVDIIELGSIELSKKDKKKYAIYQCVENLSDMIPKKKKKGQMFVGLYRGPDTPIDEIPERQSGMVDGVRVIIRYSELRKSLDFCAALSRKGYKVFVQPVYIAAPQEELVRSKSLSADVLKEKRTGVQDRKCCRRDAGRQLTMIP